MLRATPVLALKALVFLSVIPAGNLPFFLSFPKGICVTRTTPMTLRQALSQLAAPIARRDAETLALHLLGYDRAWLHAHPEAPISEEQLATLQALVQRRGAGEPLQYLTGHQEFFGLDLEVTPAVLIPRPETEHLVEAVLAWAATQTGELHLADVGTGSGAIALALAAHLPHARITAADLSRAALEVATRNAARLGLEDHVWFAESDLLDGLQQEGWDAIVSNPPYIALSEAASLAPEVRDHEPATALFAGSDGMDLYRRLIPAAAQALRPGGLLAMEFGFGQQPRMEELFRMQPSGQWQSWETTSDLQGIPRVVTSIRA